jgi:hypothetical protein
MLESLLLNSTQMQRVRIHKLEIIIPDIELINGFCNLDGNNTKLEEMINMYPLKSETRTGLHESIR